ncbi:MAG: KH domain-containing protein [Candidatus Paceibacterota bacterium]|nr:MAG: KH domain-containing protein [Candidatus Paceibacterota bacterium]
MAQEADRDFVAYVVQSIVSKPEEVRVTRTVDELGVLISVKVHRDDMGLLIGRSGATAKAIRTLARIVGMRHEARVNLRIEEPDGGKMAGASKDVDAVVSELGM